MILFEKGWNADKLEQRYYDWLTGLIPKWQKNYSILLRSLYETPFRVTLLMDENRVGDGLSMRTRFVWEKHLGTTERDVLKRQRPCSVLEVMIGLAQRFEEEYMTQYSDENPIENWFGPMISSLGLDGYDDQHFDLYGFDRTMLTFFDRTYFPDGRGSLFYIPGTSTDMRRVEIWQQMMLWNQQKCNGGIEYGQQNAGQL